MSGPWPRACAAAGRHRSAPSPDSDEQASSDLVIGFTASHTGQDLTLPVGRLDGELQGPLAHPVAIVPVLLVNALWGLIAGLLAVSAAKLRTRV